MCEFCGEVVEGAAVLHHDCRPAAIDFDFGIADIQQPSFLPSPGDPQLPIETAFPPMRVIGQAHDSIGELGNAMTIPLDYNNEFMAPGFTPRPHNMIITAPSISSGATMRYNEDLGNPGNTTLHYKSRYPLSCSRLDPQSHIMALPAFRIGSEAAMRCNSNTGNSITFPAPLISSGAAMAYNGNMECNIANLVIENNNMTVPWQPQASSGPANPAQLMRPILPDLSMSEKARIQRKMKESTKRFVINRQLDQLRELEQSIPSPCEFCRTRYPQLSENQVYDICSNCMEAFLEPLKDQYIQDCLILRGAVETDINDRFPPPKGSVPRNDIIRKPIKIQAKPWELLNFKPPEGYIPCEISEINRCIECVFRRMECWLMAVSFGCCYTCATYGKNCARVPQDYQALLHGPVASEQQQEDVLDEGIEDVQTP